MEIRTFWRIIIKGIGLWLLINSIYVIPQFASSFFFIESGGLNWENLISVWFIIFGTLAVYLLITGFFLFKTEWIVTILRLDQKFTENRIDVNLPYKNVLSIAVIVVGALVFVEAIPALCSNVYDFVKQKELIKDYSGTSLLIFYFLQAISGYLIMTNSKTIVKFIDKQNNDDIKP